MPLFKKTAKNLVFAAVLCTLGAAPAFADAGEGDAEAVKLKFNRLEARNHDGENSYFWNLDFWAGGDVHKFWVKSKGARASGETEGAFFEMLYNRTITPHWDFQAGWRREQMPKPERNWLTLGFEGEAPYALEVDAALLLGENSRSGLRAEIARELTLAPKLTLEPEVEFFIYGRNDPEIGLGSGFSKLELSMRMQYELHRQLEPYVGVKWEKKYGNTADYARAEGEGTEEFFVLAGLRFWFGQ